MRSTQNPFTDQYTPNMRRFIGSNEKVHTNSIVPSDSRPVSGMESHANGPDFKARPIRHWRKQLNPNGSSGRGRSNLGMPMDTPGGSVYLGNQTNESDCQTCSDPTDSFSAGLKEFILRTNIKIRPAVPGDKGLSADGTATTCVACNPENNIIRSATTILSPTYYSDTKGYLKSRCLLYDQKLSTTRVPGIQYTKPCATGCGVIIVEPTDSPTGTQVRLTQNCQQQSCSSGNGKAGTTIYKPSNAQFATQGAVSSSSRIDRLKYNTITQNGNSLRTAWGSEGANAGKYQGTSTAPYFLKSKYQVPTVFHARQNKQICGSASNCKPAQPPLVITF